MYKPLVAITLQLPHPLTGADIMAAVSDVATGGISSYFQTAQTDGTYLVGQTSGYPYNQIMVGSAADKPGISPERVYPQLVIMSHDAGEGFPVYFSDDQVLTAVYAFTHELLRFLFGRTSYSDQKRRFTNHSAQ